MVERRLGFTFGRTKEGDERDYEELERRLAQQATTPPIPDTTQTQQTSGIVTPITTNPAYWTIPDVTYRGKVGNVDIQKTLLDNGKTKTQSEWASYSELTRASGGFYTPDYPLFYASLERAFDLKDDAAYKRQVEEMRTTLKGLSRANWLTTLTRIKYSPKGKDTIVHNFGLKDEYETLENFIGNDGELPAKSPINVYRSLLGTQDSLDKIKDVFQWLNNTPTYIWRVNSRPKSVDERVAWFYADSSGSLLSCYRYPTVTYPSLGVRFARRAAPSAAKNSGGSS